MKKFLLSCVALAACTTMAMAQELPAYPDKLDFTLNGEKELTGVTVSQTMVPYDGSECLTIKITGESDADVITMDFVTPEGWDYSLIDSMIGGANSPFKTRSGESDHWLPVNSIEKSYKEGNSFSFPVNGKDSYATIYLVKGDNFWEYSIDIEFKVSKAGGSEKEMPEYPEALDITLNGEKELAGVTVTQTIVPYDNVDYLAVNVNGETDADFITLDFATPAGWDYMLVRSDYDGESEEIEPLKAKAPAKDDEELWMDASMAQWYGVAPGNSLTFPVDGEEWTGMALLVKGEEAYMANIDFIFQVSKTGGSDVPGDNPALPNHLEYTLNGEKEIKGIVVRQLIDETTHVFSVTGECDYDKITLTFETPEGWDGLMIADTWGEGEIGTVKTRGTEMIPVKDILGQGFVEGNSITYKTDGEAQWGSIALIKGDMACSTFIDYDFTVSKSSGPDVPGDNAPLIPESIGITTYAEGLIVEQEKDPDDGSIYIDVTGSIAEEEYELILDVPSGWDGYVILPYSENVTVGDHNIGPRKIAATDHEWVPIKYVLDEGYIKGNKITVKVTSNWEFAYAYLYKDEKVDNNAFIAITSKVGQGSGNLIEDNQKAYDAVIAELEALQAEYEEAVEEIKKTNPDFDFTEWEEIGNMIEQYKGWAAQALASANEEGESFFFPFDGEEIEGYIAMMVMASQPSPEFPETFDVTLSDNNGVEVSQSIEQDVYTISVSGKSEQEEITLTIAVPEGWDGFICMSEDNSDIEPLSTRAEESEWWPVESMLEFGAVESNSVTFPVDGEEHFGQFLLVKNGLADVANQINVEFIVEYSDPDGVSSINATDKTSYYDLNGNKISNPKNGMYIKVVDGKASKVILK
ncbi:MAG: hypothetical protein K2K75_09980 [Muribaculaceae bacterium]|nr:hypothetical protein [Muribaculaceae bacterium]